jgi:putative transposase
MVKGFNNKKVSNRWIQSNTSVYNLGYHLIWCPKYRRKVLNEKIAKRLKQLLIMKSKEIDTEIVTMEILEDHVHLFVKSKPIASPHWIVQQLKGFSSHQLRKEFPELVSKLPTLWTRSYFCESVGHISENTVKKYIEEQKNK